MTASIGATISHRTALEADEYGFQIMVRDRVRRSDMPHVEPIVRDIVLGHGVEPCHFSYREPSADGRWTRLTFVWRTAIPSLVDEIERGLNERIVAHLPMMAGRRVSLVKLDPFVVFDHPTQLVLEATAGGGA
jgi:hypothetical protein